MAFVHTSPFRRDDRKYSRVSRVQLRRQSSDTAEIVTAAVACIERIYRSGYNFSKAGMHLLDLQSKDMHQCGLPLDEDLPARARLMAGMDWINQRFGHSTLSIASAGLPGDRREWVMRQEYRKLDYMTRWENIPIAKA